MQDSGELRREIAEAYLVVIASVSEAIHEASGQRCGLIRRGACHRARIRATCCLTF